MKLRPCPKCKSTDISPHDCGYSSFNPGWAECNKCGYKVDAIGRWVDSNKDSSIVRGWNKITDQEKINGLRKQLRNNGLNPLF